ncbi:hypothetical protein MAR_010710, partial [Mya arenaria]
PKTCGEIYKGSHGNLGFQSAAGTFDSNHNCVQGIMATPPEKIEIHIVFDLEDSVVFMRDKIKIFDNDAPKGQANKTLCGRGNFTFISSGPAVAIQFISDEKRRTYNNPLDNDSLQYSILTHWFRRSNHRLRHSDLSYWLKSLADRCYFLGKCCVCAVGYRSHLLLEGATTTKGEDRRGERVY